MLYLFFFFFYGYAEGVWLKTSCHWLPKNYKAKLINDLDQMAHLTLVPLWSCSSQFPAQAAAGAE